LDSSLSQLKQNYERIEIYLQTHLLQAHQKAFFYFCTSTTISMSDAIKHECGIAVIRLLKPLDFYQKKYGNALYGLNKLYLLMEKQHNRGQDGAGVATIKLNPVPGYKYIDRIRSNSSQPIKEIFQKIYEPLQAIEEKDPGKLKDGQWLKNNVDISLYSC
jgi:amidophosphoribosyltransferase